MAADLDNLKERFARGITAVIVTTRGPGPKEARGDIISFVDTGNPVRVNIPGHSYSGAFFSIDELTPADEPALTT